MKRIYITSLNRVRDPNEEGDLGKLYVLDWDTKQIVPHAIEGEAIKIGRSRGIRGITWWNNTIMVAGVTNKMMLFNPDTMELINEWTRENSKFLHQIRTHNSNPHCGEELFEASTGNDRLVCGSHWYELSHAKDIIDPYITDPSFPDWGNDRLHFNSMAWDENHDQYHIYNSPRMIFNWTRMEVFMQGGPLNSLHDIVVNPSHIIVNSSGDRTTLAINRKTKEISVIHKNRSQPHGEYNLHGMTRGLAQFENHLFVGITPGTIVCFQLNTGNEWEYDSHVVLSNDRHESIFDILLDPRDWQ